jgi:hypothetical protein
LCQTYRRNINIKGVGKRCRGRKGNLVPEVKREMMDRGEGGDEK